MKPSRDKKRANRALEIVGNTEAITNGLRLPLRLPRYMGVEEGYDGPVWGYFADCLSGIGKEIVESETECVHRYRVYDLDSKRKFAPVMHVLKFVEVESE